MALATYACPILGLSSQGKPHSALTHMPLSPPQVWRGEHFASNQGEYNQIKGQLQSESFPPLIPGEPNRCEWLDFTSVGWVWKECTDLCGRHSLISN